MQPFLSLLTRLPRSTLNSLRGLRDALKDEPAFRLELIAAAILAPLAIYLGENGVERALLIAPLLIALIAELLNSAIESAIDRIGEQPHDLSRRAKDLASAAVFVSLALVAIVWALVLLS